MRRRLALFAVSAAAFLAAVGSVEAKRVFYEVDGQRYSYSTNNRAQVKDAHRRMEAARSASSARAQGEAERAATPLARILSPAAPQAQTVEATSSTGQAGVVARDETTVRSRRPARHSRAELRRSQREARAEKAQHRRELLAERRRLAAEKRREKLAAARSRKAAPERSVERLAAQPPQTAETAGVVARSEPAENPKPLQDPSSTQSVRPAPAKTVSFDLSSGIKTIERTDGTLHEEPFDSTAVAKLGLTEAATDKGLTDFVDQLRTPAR